MSTFPELLAFKELDKDVIASEAAAFIESMQQEGLETCSEEKKDLLVKMAQSLRGLDTFETEEGADEEAGPSSKRIVFDDDDDEEEEGKKVKAGGDDEEMESDDSDGSDSDDDSDSD